MSHAQKANNLFEDTILLALCEDFEFTNVHDAKVVINSLVKKLQNIDPTKLVVEIE